jgi:hypothetical protein
MFAKYQRCLLAVAVVCTLAVRAGATEPIILAPQQGFLVLANGSVLKGVVALDGNHYRVLLEKGKLQVRADQVDFFCQSMEEAYIRRKARRISKNAAADAHLELARWCVQHQLFASAATELQDARAIDPKQPQIPFVERQLSQAQMLAEQQNDASTKANPPVTFDRQVQPAAAIVVETTPACGEIPAWARTEFIKRVQPMMVHSCATAGCHVINSSQQMRIERSALDGVGNPEVINRNLISIIGQVNFTDPEASQLLALGAATHGVTDSEQSKPLTPHQLEILRAWVTQLALREPPADHEFESGPAIAQVVIGMNSTAQRAALAAEKPSVASQDPFDPAAFNSEHARTAETETASSEPIPQSSAAPSEAAQ